MQRKDLMARKDDVRETEEVVERVWLRLAARAMHDEGTLDDEGLEKALELIAKGQV